MTVALPAPYGKADWTDYVDYWRDADVTWMQDRLVLRYADSGTGGTGRGSGTGFTAGQVTYLANPDRLEYFTSASKWIGLIGAENLKVSPINAANNTEAVTLSHIGSAGGAGLNIGKDLTSVSTDTDLHSVLKVTGTGATGFVSVKTGALTAKLTTDTLNLISDLPIKAPGFTATSVSLFTGLTAQTITALTSTTTNTLSVTTSATTNTLSVTTSATIVGVSFPGSADVRADTFLSLQGKFVGTAASAVMRQFDTADGASYFEVGETNIHLLATADFTIEGQTKIFESKGLIYYNGSGYATPGTILGYGGPVVYSSTALTASNYPPGTIWVS